MDALGLWMDGYAGSMFHWAGILPTFLHIFLAIISAMELMLRPYISCHSPGGTGDSRAFYGTVLSNFIQNIPRGLTLLVTALTPYRPLYWFCTQAVTRKGRKTMSLISICLNLESK